MAAVKSQAGCLLSRLGSVGEVCVEVGTKRIKVVRWERRWQKEMMVRRGEFGRRREKERQAKLRVEMWDGVGDLIFIQS